MFKIYSNIFFICFNFITVYYTFLYSLKQSNPELFMSATKHKNQCALFADVNKRKKLWLEINKRYSEKLARLRTECVEPKKEIKLFEKWIEDMRDQNRILFEIVQYFEKETAVEIHNDASEKVMCTCSEVNGSKTFDDNFQNGAVEIYKNASKEVVCARSSLEVNDLKMVNDDFQSRVVDDSNMFNDDFQNGEVEIYVQKDASEEVVCVCSSLDVNDLKMVDDDFQSSVVDDSKMFNGSFQNRIDTSSQDMCKCVIEANKLLFELKKSHIYLYEKLILFHELSLIKNQVLQETEKIIYDL